MNSTQETNFVPDWSVIAGEILCPLCDYNLRGLTEARCPECGYQTIWKELLDAEQGRHPWLFEHRERHRVRAFGRTLYLSHWPRTFWSEVRPTHVPRGWRLILYWVLVSMMVVVPLLISASVPIGRDYYSIYQGRERQRTYLLQREQVDPILAQDIQLVGIDAFLDPYPSLREAIYSSGVSDTQWRYVVYVFVPMALIHLLWPWLSLGVMSIFRQTLRQTAIKPVHILRCTIYSADVGFVLGAIVCPVLLLVEPDLYFGVRFGGVLLHPTILGLLLACEGVLIYRLMVAYKRYLGFPHAAATVVLSQIVVVLAFLTFYSILLVNKHI